RNKTKDKFISSGNRSLHSTINKQRLIVYGRKIENKSFYCRQGLPFNCSSGTRRRNSGCRKKNRSNDLTARRKFCHAGQTRCSGVLCLTVCLTSRAKQNTKRRRFRRF